MQLNNIETGEIVKIKDAFTISGKIPCGVPGVIPTYCRGERKAAMKKV